jgi:hypothetical protein
MRMPMQTLRDELQKLKFHEMRSIKSEKEEVFFI